jgi:hypothetical protein
MLSIFMDKDMIELFNNEYKEDYKGWNKHCIVNGKVETYSGPGSLLSNTENLIENLQEFIKDNEIKSIIDVPCGDFNYMKEVDLEGIDYKGYDVSFNAIERCKKYKKDNINFEVLDATKDSLPYADLIICKDLFLHLSLDNISLILKNIIDSKCKYFATSRYEGGSKGNNSNSSAQARPIEVTKDPFNFDYPIVSQFRYTIKSNLRDEIIIFKIN